MYRAIAHVGRERNTLIAVGLILTYIMSDQPAHDDSSQYSPAIRGGTQYIAFS